jgi:peptidoglycan/xylan/chitin deacetylase (PgdA/CDA1 family)
MYKMIDGAPRAEAVTGRKKGGQAPRFEGRRARYVPDSPSLLPVAPSVQVAATFPATLRATVAGPLVSVSVDLDGIECYFRIHALPGAPPASARYAVLRRCLPRLAELFALHGVTPTWFVVGRDVEEDAEGRRLLAELASAGHELANHSYSHPYDLVRLPRLDIAAQIDRAHAAVADVAGRAPEGFRAPGYEVSAEVLELLGERGYRYDSSAFPSLPYYAAKAAVMAAMRVRGQASGSILGRPAVLGAPLTPYRPRTGEPYRRGDAPLWELPMAVTPGLRLPVIGTSLITAPAWLRRRLVAAALRTPFVNLELHGIDLADAEADGLPPALIARQPDLRRPLEAKRAALDATLTEARAAGARFCTLRDAVAQLPA